MPEENEFESIVDEIIAANGDKDKIVSLMEKAMLKYGEGCMSKKKKPTGFVAECQCGLIVGALDYNRTDRKDAGKIIGQWLHDGCKVIPMFDSSWQAACNVCRCDT